MTTTSEVTQRSFITPEGVVSVSNITIDVKTNKFTAEVKLKVGRSKAVVTEVAGKLSQELRAWFIKKDKFVYIDVEDPSVEGGVKSIRTNETTTGFKKYLEKVGIKFVPGVLNTMIFSCPNNSEVYNDNPFRIVLMKDYAVMTLVNVPSKKRQVYEDPNTGKETVKYFTKRAPLKTDHGTFIIDAYVNSKEYRRFVYEKL